VRSSRRLRIALATLLICTVVVGGIQIALAANSTDQVHVVAYFENSNGIFAGDQVRILGVPVGKIDAIEPQPQRVKISFWYDRKYHVPADAKAVILSPSLVTARTIQLTPAYTGGPMMADGTTIPQSRTLVPVEFDELRTQLQRLTDTLQPTQPGGTSTLGQFVNTAADNLRGQGANLRDTVIKLSQAFSILGDHSNDLFTTIRNLSVLVSALESSADLTRQLNNNLAGVTSLLADDPNKIDKALVDLNAAVGDARTFVAENREAIGTTFDKLAPVTQAVQDSMGSIKQLLHAAPTTLANFANIYQPAQGALSGILALPNFNNPISFICGAIQAASRLNFEQSAKLCVQYLAPIVKNRQYNFLPLGVNPFVGAQARPNEITYSEDWLRPDYQPPASPPLQSDQPPPPAAATSGGPDAPLAAEATTTDPAAGLPGMMLPPGVTGP